MRNSVVTALRGVLAGLASLAFVLFFLLAEVRVATLPVFVGLIFAGIACLVAAAGPSAVLHLFGFGTPSNETGTEEPEWWLARLEPALENSWNKWSDAVLTLGLGALGVGSFVLLAVYPGDEPPIGLLVVGFLGINCALISLAFVFK